MEKSRTHPAGEASSHSGAALDKTARLSLSFFSRICHLISCEDKRDNGQGQSIVLARQTLPLSPLTY